MGQYEKLRSLLYEQAFKLLRKIKRKPVKNIQASEIDLLFLKARIDKPEDRREEEEPLYEVQNEMLSLLSEREMDVINAIYFTGEGMRSIKKVAEEKGLSPRRINQIRHDAYKKMRSYRR